ncbi:hypothetical protein AMJ57_01785 [Parcubacteria bacterium SG8_24]|nr:MAG: hypothetical protein AMJ57_01785 [Parcubacteria bacterium SG8_24]
MSPMKADRPTAGGGRQYHIETGPGDLAERCILVGSPERAELIATELFEKSRKVGDHRGLRSFTGQYGGVPMSVVTTGMGSASTGIVLPEAVRTGARAFIRVGTCAALWSEVELGDAAICTAAVRLDGASENWAPIEYPAAAHWRVVAALHDAAECLRLPFHAGIGVTTTCFNEGQARPDDNDYIPPRILAMHEELVQRGALFYSMEEATLFVWCSTHGGYPCGAVDAVIGNRIRNTFRVGGEKNAALIACEALARLRL